MKKKIATDQKLKELVVEKLKYTYGPLPAKCSFNSLCCVCYSQLMDPAFYEDIYY